MNQVQKDYIKEQLHKLRESHPLNLENLENQQELAIQIGELVEQLEGEGTGLVSALEHYCGVIYELYTILQEMDNSTCVADRECDPRKSEVDLTHGDKLIALQEELLHTAAQALAEAENIVLRKQILFLPYQASMWDSLEGAWQEQVAKAENQVWVCPLPYYNKNERGEFVEEHYHPEEYPEKLNVRSYQQVILAPGWWDEIYIHNPYDGGNHITSVPPEFYAKNLKHLTDCLVYIPYFVLNEIDPGNAAQMVGIEHFCYLPGVIHAHKVYVQSEAMRKVYLQVLAKKIPEETIPASYWEQKIIARESSKIELLRRYVKQGVKPALPKEWQQVLERAGYECSSEKAVERKIILYNTSVAPALQRPEQVLRKIESVLAKCRELPLILWWRPHPLLEETLSAQGAAYGKRYRELVEKYCQEGWGILDTTPDLTRALLWADAYYGDQSSLVAMYKETNRPILIQNINFT